MRLESFIAAFPHLASCVEGQTEVGKVPTYPRKELEPSLFDNNTPAFCPTLISFAYFISLISLNWALSFHLPNQNAGFT